MHTWIAVAQLTRTKTLSGGLVARSAAGLPFLLRAGLEVAFVPPRHDAPRRGIVNCVQYDGKDSYLVTFEGINSIESAESLVGCLCLVRRVDVPHDMLLTTGNNLLGYKIYDACENLIGVVTGIETGVAQTLLSVSRAHGKGEVLIPLVDAFIAHFDETAGRIDVVLPDGLLDL